MNTWGKYKNEFGTEITVTGTRNGYIVGHTDFGGKIRIKQSEFQKLFTKSK